MWYSVNILDRVLAWRQWRLLLEEKEFEEALKIVATDWAHAPRASHYLLPDLVDEWPTPWVLINENYYCDLAVSLGMVYSLLLSKHAKNHDIKLLIYKDTIEQTWYNLVVVDNKFVLNWDLRVVSDMSVIPTTATLVYQIDKLDLKKQIGN